MTFRKLLQKLPYFVTFLIAIIMTVSVDTNAVKQLSGIKFRWTKHTKPKYQWWSTEMNIRYNFSMTGRKFNNLWDNPNDKTDLKDDAFDLINTFIWEEIHSISDHKGQRSTHESVARIKDRLDEAKLYWARKDQPGMVELISTTEQLAVQFGKMQDDNKVADMIVSEDNEYFVLYLKSGVLYPENDDIMSLNWSKILTQPPVVAPAALSPDLIRNKTQMTLQLFV